MATNYVQPGKALDHTAGGTITSGSVVVLGDSVGFAAGDAGSGDSVAVHVEGVFTAPKATGTAWNQGDALSWDASASAFEKGVTPASGDVIGCAYAAEDAASASATGKVKLANPGAAE